jgi:hypothetical protein
VRSTPVEQIESYFDVKLDRSGIRHLRRIPDGDWVDFAMQYESTVNESFAKGFLEAQNREPTPLSLYFEPTLRETWDAAAHHLYGSTTPLLGMKTDAEGEIDPNVASLMLEPLKKHLLVADSVYVEDNFFDCFKVAALNGPNAAFHIARLKAWLPLLMELRPLIESRALVFMPSWLTPSFPYSNYTIEQMNALKLGSHRPAPAPDTGPPPRLDFRISPERMEAARRRAIEALSNRDRWDPKRTLDGREVNAVISAWLNARLLGLNPVFPDQAMYDFGSYLYFRGEGDEDRSFKLTSDLMSFDILPLGKNKPVSIKELMSLRKNEEGFAAVRSTVMTCQQRLKDGLTSQATQEDAQRLCAAVIDDYQATYGGKARQVVRFLSQNIIAGTVLSIAVGAAMIPTAGISAAIGVFAPAFLSPAVANIVVNRRNPEMRALTQLQAIL